MRLVSYLTAEGPRAGVLRGEKVIDAWTALGSSEGASGEGAFPRHRAGLRALLDEDRLAELAAVVAEAEPTAAASELQLLPPITDPAKIVCIGLNYRDHAAEAGLDPPDSPTFFAKFANALVPDRAEVSLPAASEKVDFEAEIAFIVGRRASEVDRADALGHVAGYTLLNDLSARDLQFATPQWIPGKVFDGSAPCGPALLTADEIRDPASIEIALDLNGERMQQSSTAELIFGVAELVARLSRLMTLEPGDIVSTGTPAGVGSTRKPRVWLADGDELVVSSPELGELHTTIRR